MDTFTVGDKETKTFVKGTLDIILHLAVLQCYNRMYTPTFVYPNLADPTTVKSDHESAPTGIHTTPTRTTTLSSSAYIADTSTCTGDSDVTAPTTGVHDTLSSTSSSTGTI